MEDTNFKNAFQYVLENEGTIYTNAKDDLGGPTKYGITLKLLSKYLGHFATDEDVKNLTQDQAQEIYFKEFWTPLRASELPEPIAITLFDTAVNKGQAAAVSLAQHCLINIKEDGIIGEETIESLKLTDSETFVYNFIGALQNAQIEICLLAPSQMKFLKGWMARARRLFLLVGK